MKQAKYERKGPTIQNLETGEFTTHYTKGLFSDKTPSVNAAKRASRLIQLKEDGALGRGSVRVVDKFTKPKLQLEE